MNIPIGEDAFDALGRYIALEQLPSLGDVWVGPDVVVEKGLTIPPLANIQTALAVNKHDFPEIDITRGALGSLDWSVRSCLAQSGLEVFFYRGYISDRMIEDIRKGKLVTIPVWIKSHVRRPIRLYGPVMRFFWVNDRKRLRHSELRQAIGQDLMIEGKEGVDWSFGDADLEVDEVRMVAGTDPALLKDLCIKLAIEPKLYIPRSDVPFQVRSKRDLPMYQRHIPHGWDTRFSIGETVKVSLGPNIIGVINLGTYGHGRRHIQSPLIDPGFVGPIRTETLWSQKYIELFLYRNGKG